MGDLIASAPPDASATVRGLMNTTAQILAGLKTFASPTAGASDYGVKMGTSVADVSVVSGFKMASFATGIGGTEKEWARFTRPVGYGGSVLRLLNPAAQVNTYQIAMDGCSGVGGLVSYGSSNLGFVELHGGQAASYLSATNRGLLLQQNSNSYDTSTLMRFNVLATAGVAATIPVFDFESSAALQTNQKLMRWKVNGSEVMSLDGSGSSVNLIIGGAVGGGFLSVVPGSYILDTQNLRAATLNATAYLGTSVGGAFKMYCDAQNNEGRMDFLGTDSSASPGAATINRPTGKSAIASGATTCVITNSLVSAGSRVMVTFHGDHGAARWWVVVGSGSFTVTLSAAASANTAFSWEVSNLL